MGAREPHRALDSVLHRGAAMLVDDLVTWARWSWLVLAACSTASTSRELRVCADPDNLPFSNRPGEGFENKLAELVARDLGATLHYTWSSQRSAPLVAGECDVVFGVPAADPATTRPYYTAEYAFVTRRDRDLELQTLEQLRGLRVGARSPHVAALAQLEVTGYGEDLELLDAVQRGDIDVAIAWGPPAGYFAPAAGVPLAVVPVVSAEPGMAMPIAIGVRESDGALRGELDAILDRERTTIESLLDYFGVPRES